jgi:anthranilate 1,2-dioxygenase small subunit
MNPVLQEVRELHEAYCHCLDDGDYQAWPDMFTEDAQYRVISMENYSRNLPISSIWCNGIGMIRDRIIALEKVLWHQPRAFRHFISGSRVVREYESGIEAQANFLVIECMVDAEPEISVCGRYFDVLVRQGAALRIRSRDCVYDNYRLRTSLTVPV